MTLRTSLATVIITFAGLFSAPKAHALQDQPGAEPATTVVGEPEAWEPVPGVTRAAILTAEGMVGMQFAAKPLREAIPMLKAEGIDLVVIRVNSGGGMLSEAMAISDVLHEEFEKEFEVVCWVDSAILSAAAATISVDSVVFCKRGNWGGALDGFGDFAGRAEQRAKAVEPLIGMLSERSEYPDFVIRAVFSSGPVSCDVDPETGRPIYRNDDRGEIVLCGPGEYLSLDSQLAQDSGFSIGTADTLVELEDLLETPRQNIVWVGQSHGEGPFPFCMAERHLRAYRDHVDLLNQRLDEMINDYQTELENAKSTTVDRRNNHLRRAEGSIRRMRQLVEINPSFGLANGLTNDWFAQQEAIVASLRAE